LNIKLLDEEAEGMIPWTTVGFIKEESKQVFMGIVKTAMLTNPKYTKILKKKKPTITDKEEISLGFGYTAREKATQLIEEALTA